MMVIMTSYSSVNGFSTRALLENTDAIKSNPMLVFLAREKPKYPEKNLSEQSREPTKSTHI